MLKHNVGQWGPKRVAAITKNVCDNIFSFILAVVWGRARARQFLRLKALKWQGQWQAYRGFVTGKVHKSSSHSRKTAGKWSFNSGWLQNGIPGELWSSSVNWTLLFSSTSLRTSSEPDTMPAMEKRTEQTRCELSQSLQPTEGNRQWAKSSSRQSHLSWAWLY